MKLSIRNFRKFKSLDLEFNDGKTLLSGASGAGKTTILNSIVWVLFGGMKHTDHPEGGKTSITLELDNIKITRAKRPTTLILTVGDKTYNTETIAQPKIDEIFGCKSTWLTTSYISQGNRNYILTTSNTERFDILKSLLFNENTNVDIDRITNKINEFKETFDSKRQTFTIEASNLEREFKSSGLETSKANFELLDELKQSTKHYELKALKVLKNRNDEILIKRKFIAEELEKIQTSLSLIPSTFDDLDHEADVNVYKKFKDAGVSKDLYDRIKPIVKDVRLDKERWTYLTKRLASIKVDNLPNISITLEDVQRLKEYERAQTRLKQLPKIDGDYNLDEAIQQQTYRSQIAKLNLPTTTDEASIDELKSQLTQLLIKDKMRQDQMAKFSDYDRTVVERKISNLTKLLDKQESIKIQQKRKELEDFIKTNPIENDIEQKIKDVDEMILASKSLQCPHCEGHVIYQDQRLIPLKVGKVGDSLQTLQARKKVLEKMRSYEPKVELCKRELETLPKINEDLSNLKILSQTEMKQAIEMVGKLRSIEWIDDVKPDIIRVQRLINDNHYRTISSKIIKDYPEPNQIHLINERKELLKIVNPMLDMTSKIAQEIFDNNVRRVEFDKVQQDISSIKIIDISNDALNLIETHRWVNVDERLLMIDFKQLRDNKIRYQHLIEKKVELTKSLKQLIYDDTLDSRIDELEQIVDFEQETIKHTELLQYFKTKKSELKVEQTLVNQIGEKLHHLTILKSYAIKVENDLLMNAVNTLNNILSDNCSKMFEDPISVRLELIKNNRPSIGINIEYKGMEYDVSMLSGGELDRISLALTLAFNSISNSSILLLDECLSSLDGRNKENALRCLGDGRITITADHEAVEGYYDEVVSVI